MFDIVCCDASMVRDCADFVNFVHCTCQYKNTLPKSTNARMIHHPKNMLHTLTPSHSAHEIKWLEPNPLIFNTRFTAGIPVFLGFICFISN
jgi:hypothetical protein